MFALILSNWIVHIKTCIGFHLMLSFYWRMLILLINFFIINLAWPKISLDYNAVMFEHLLVYKEVSFKCQHFIKMWFQIQFLWIFQKIKMYMTHTPRIALTSVRWIACMVSFSDLGRAFLAFQNQFVVFLAQKCTWRCFYYYKLFVFQINSFENNKCTENYIFIFLFFFTLLNNEIALFAKL